MNPQLSPSTTCCAADFSKRRRHSRRHGLRWKTLLLAGALALATNGYGQGLELGKVLYWGDNSFSQGKPPANIGPVRDIAAGSGFSLGLRANGTVAAWGLDVVGETDVPPGLNNVVSVKAGVYHSLALKADGTVVAWGDNTQGQRSVPPGLSGVTAISAGHWHNLALKNDGTVVAWGGNGQSETVVPPGLNNVIAVAAGGRHSAALKSDGTVEVWGDNVQGETNVPLGLSGVVAIAAGQHHMLALKDDGGVVAWGDNANDQLTLPPGLGTVAAISAGYQFSVALRTNGTVVAWGENNFNQTLVPSSIKDVFAIAAGSGHVLALATLPPAPIINITGNGAFIPRGDTTPAAADHTHFGATSVIDGTVTRTFTIRNDGNLDLELTGVPDLVTLTGAQADDFEVVAQPTTPVASEGATTFDITFNPSALGNRSATVRVLSNDDDKSPYTFVIRGTGNVPPGTPTVKLTSPGTAKTISATSPLPVAGTAADDGPLDRVEVVLNGGAPIIATLGVPTPKSVPFSAEVTPLAGENTLVVTAFDADGNPSVPVTRTFTFEQRYLVTITRQVPPAQTLTPDKAGTVALVAAPSGKASKLTKGPAPQTSAVVAGTPVKLTATARSGHLFSHWNGLPAGAVATGNVMNFVMPAQDEPDVTAVFVENPLLPAFGSKKIFRGLLLPAIGTTPGNDTVGYLTANLVSSKGSATGKIYLNGRATAFTVLLMGDGTAWFKVGKNLLEELVFNERTLAVDWDNDGLHLLVTATAGESAGLARFDAYSSALPVPVDLLNQNGKTGYFTFILPAKPQMPAIPLSDYPQGTGFATITLAKTGTLRFVATLADGTKTTISSALVTGDTSPVFAQLATPGSKLKGGSFSGSLVFDTTQADSDVTAADMAWFRPAVVEGKSAATKPYTAGWPQGVTIDAFGVHYDKTLPMQAGLLLPAADPLNGNARLFIDDGKLTAPVEISNFNINASKVAKIPLNDKTFTLSLTQGSGLIKGSFTPNWTDPAPKLPAFQGVVLQKGANIGGYGYFMSNRLNDNDPESGAVELTDQP